MRPPLYGYSILTCHFEQSEKSPREISHYIRDDTVIKSELRQSPLLNNVLLIRNFINIPEYIYMDEERQ